VFLPAGSKTPKQISAVKVKEVMHFIKENTVKHTFKLSKYAHLTDAEFRIVEQGGRIDDI